jgi:hypothetical protein
MSSGISKHTFAVAVRVKRSNQEAAALPRAEPELRLPRLRPCEIAAAVGFEAVRHALEEMLAAGQAAI